MIWEVNSRGENGEAFRDPTLQDYGVCDAYVCEALIYPDLSLCRGLGARVPSPQRYACLVMCLVAVKTS